MNADVALLDVKKITLDQYVYKCGLRIGDCCAPVCCEIDGEYYADIGWSEPTDRYFGEFGAYADIDRIYPERNESIAAFKITLKADSHKCDYLEDVVNRAQEKNILKGYYPDVPAVGSRVPILFVCSSATHMEKARKFAMVGQIGKVFKDVYLKALDLYRYEVGVLHLVPMLCTDDKGNFREPTESEIAYWKPWFEEQVALANPHIIVAMGASVREALGDRSDMFLPYPKAVMRYGDTGEVGRKLARIKTHIQSVLYANRDKATVLFDAHYPVRNFAHIKNEFVIQDSGDISSICVNFHKNSMPLSINCSKSLLTNDEAEVTFTDTSYPEIESKAAELQQYSGSVTTHLVYDNYMEFSFDSPMFKGTYSISRENNKNVMRKIAAPNTDKLETIVKNLHNDGKRWLVYNDGIDLSLYDVTLVYSFVSLIWYNEHSYDVTIWKSDDEKRLVYGVVLEPDFVDAQGDLIDADTIEKAAHNYMAHYRTIGLQHMEVAEDIELVESYIAPVEFMAGEQVVPQGSWIMVSHVLDDLTWEAVKAGVFTGYSIGGYGKREVIKE